jgi:hypothetical protein
MAHRVCTLGEGAPLSAPSMARLKAGWQAEYDLWKTRSVAELELEVVYLWVDGVYVKAGLEKDKAAILVVIAGLRDGRKVVLAVESVGPVPEQPPPLHPANVAPRFGVAVSVTTVPLGYVLDGRRFGWGRDRYRLHGPEHLGHLEERATVVP